MLLLLRSLFGNNKSITYLSLIEKAKADYSFYAKLASGSFLAGISSFFSSSSWLSKIPLITGAVFGTSSGIKGIMDSKEKIDIFTKAHEETKSTEYLATSELGSLIYGTAVDENGIDKFTGKYLAGINGKIISNKMIRVPTLSSTEDGIGYKCNGGYTIVESADRVMYQKIPGVQGQYTNKLVQDINIISLQDNIVKQLIQKGYSNEDIEQALNLNTAEKRENYKNTQIAEYKPSLSSKVWHGTEKAMKNKEAELSKEIQTYAEINSDYKMLLDKLTPNFVDEEHIVSEKEVFYSLVDSFTNDNETNMLGSDEGYETDFSN